MIHPNCVCHVVYIIYPIWIWIFVQPNAASLLLMLLFFLICFPFYLFICAVFLILSLVLSVVRLFLINYESLYEIIRKIFTVLSLLHGYQCGLYAFALSQSLSLTWCICYFFISSFSNWYHTAAIHTLRTGKKNNNIHITRNIRYFISCVHLSVLFHSQRQHLMWIYTYLTYRARQNEINQYATTASAQIHFTKTAHKKNTKPFTMYDSFLSFLNDSMRAYTNFRL